MPRPAPLMSGLKRRTVCYWKVSIAHLASCIRVSVREENHGLLEGGVAPLRGGPI